MLKRCCRAWLVFLAPSQLVTMAVYWTYVFGPAAAHINSSMRPSYSFYDAAGFAAARFLLPAKQQPEGEQQLADPLQASLPGLPGRWRLADDLADTEAYLQLAASLGAQAALLNAYRVLQAVVTFCLVFRGLLRTIPLPRLGVSMRSLGRALPELLTFLLVAFLCVVAYMALGTLAFGHRIEKFSALSGSFAFLWELQLVAGFEDVLYEIFDPAVSHTATETIVILMYFVTAPLFFIFILYNFLLGIIMESFEHEKELAADNSLDAVLAEYAGVLMHLLRPDHSGEMAAVLAKLEGLACGGGSVRSLRNVSPADVVMRFRGESAEVQQLRVALDAFLLQHDMPDAVMRARNIQSLPLDDVKELVLQRMEEAMRKKNDTLKPDEEEEEDGELSERDILWTGEK